MINYCSNVNGPYSLLPSKKADLVIGSLYVLFSKSIPFSLLIYLLTYGPLRRLGFLPGPNKKRNKAPLRMKKKSGMECYQENFKLP